MKNPKANWENWLKQIKKEKWKKRKWFINKNQLKKMKEWNSEKFNSEYGRRIEANKGIKVNEQRMKEKVIYKSQRRESGKQSYKKWTEKLQKK